MLQASIYTKEAMMTKPSICNSLNVSEDTDLVDEAVPKKTWEEFAACERCHGHAPIDETPEGDLFCQLCRVKLPRPST